MKITKLNKRLTGAVACAAALFIGMTPMTAFAHTGPEAECTCETKCSEDFVNEEWTVEDIKAFCEKYNLKLTIAYSKTDVYNEGKIIYQSRAAKSEIVKGASLKITIAKPLDSSDNPDDEGKPAEEEQNP